MTTKHKPVIMLFMPDAGEHGIIHAWVAGSPDVKDFRGSALSTSHTGDPSAFRRIFDAVNTMHQNELLASQIVTVLPNQRDHGAVLELMDGPVGKVPVGYGHPRMRHRVSARNRPAPVREIVVKHMKSPGPESFRTAPSRRLLPPSALRPTRVSPAHV